MKKKKKKIFKGKRVNINKMNKRKRNKKIKIRSN